MKRGLVWWAFAAASIGLLVVGIALAFTPEELVRPRQIAFDCKTNPGKCEIDEEDLAFLIAQNQFLGGAAQEFFKKLRQCQAVNMERES